MTGGNNTVPVDEPTLEPKTAATLASDGVGEDKARRKREAVERKLQEQERKKQARARARARAEADKKVRAEAKAKAEAEKKAKAAVEKKAKAKAEADKRARAKVEADKKAKAKVVTEGKADKKSKPVTDDGKTPSEGERDPKWRRRKDSRPEELIAAALQIFGEQGFAKTNLKDVAKHAGVSKGTVYLYFKNKEDLLLAAVQKSVVPILDFADDYEIDSEATATEMVRTLVKRWIAEFEARSVAGLPKLVVAESGNFPELAQLFANAVLQRARRLFQRVLKRGVRAGEFRDIDVRQAVHVLLAPVIWAQIHQHSLGPHDEGFGDVESFLETHVELFLAGIRAPR